MATPLTEYRAKLLKRYTLAQQKKQIRKEVSEELAARGIDTPLTIQQRKQEALQARQAIRRQEAEQRAREAQELSSKKRELGSRAMQVRKEIAFQKSRILAAKKAIAQRNRAIKAEKKRRKFNIYTTTQGVVKDYEKERLYKQQLKQIKYEERLRAYNKTRTAKVGGALVKAVNFIRSPVSTMYASQNAPLQRQTISKGSGSRVGRPSGTYDKRYAAYGGVYGYRKMLAAKLRAQRIELQRRATVTPQQQMVINRLQAQEAYNQQNVENKIIPDTYGQVPVNNIMGEIDMYANMVG